MATFVPQTANCSKILGYSAIAEWVEANHYDLVGAFRLVFLELPKQPGDDDYVIEIQFPVRKREVELNLQSLNKFEVRNIQRSLFIDSRIKREQITIYKRRGQ